MKFFSRANLLVCIAILLCTACGQKGKLVIPTRPPAVNTPYPTATPKEDDSNADSTSAPQQH
ncbi:putative small lipoprotein YifL [Oxalobacteraceae bacterium GrIS 2.11]